MVAIPFLLYDGVAVRRDRHPAWGTGLIWVAAVLTDLVDGVLPAEGAAGDPREADKAPRERAPASCCGAMPAVFVLIWSTGFVVARYGMPHAPPLGFLALRYALSVWPSRCGSLLARAAWPRGRAQWGHLAVTGVLMHAGYLGGVWAAVKAGIGAGTVALIVGLQPVLTAIWLSLTRQRAPRLAPPVARPAARLGRAAAGGVAQAGRRRGDALSTWAWRSFALLSITVGTLYQKRFVAPCDVRTANAVQIAAAFAGDAAARAARARADGHCIPNSSARWPGRCSC